MIAKGYVATLSNGAGRSSSQADACAAGQRQKGVSLIEVLVAVLILSIAFLGIAALQAMSLSTNNSSMARSMATVASYSILDAMRADIDGAKSGAYNTSDVMKASACPTDNSTLAASQLAQWCGQLGSALGAAETTTGTVKCVSTDCTVTISFLDVRTGADNKTKQQTVVSRALL